jgi:hypothetical protein
MSDCRKLLQKVGDRWGELACVVDPQILAARLAELFPRDVFYRIAARNILRSCGQPAAYPAVSNMEIVVMVGR